MIKWFAALLVIGVISGCSSKEVKDDMELSRLAKADDEQQWQGRFGGGQRWREQALKYNVNFYVRGLMQDLISNLQYVNETTPVAVASFILLDSEYNETNILGNQISESLMHEIHKFGIPIIDYKTTDQISVNKDGDYLFSRNRKQLKKDLPIRYVFAGTLVKHQEGYLVNARVVGMASKAVVASAQTYIPEDAANAILDNARNRAKQAVELVEG